MKLSARPDIIAHGSTAALVEDAEGASVPENTGVVVYFECVDLDATCRQLKDRGFIFDTSPTDQRWLWREAYLRDPDGNVICLYRAGEARRNPPWRLPASGK